MRTMVRVAIALLWLLLALLPSAAQAEKRIALLIGNQSYTSEIGRLANPHNDIALVEQALKGLSFEVTTLRDAGLATLHQAVNGYARRVQAAGPNAVAFFYYSGHGAADAGTNYLIPVDVITTETGELWDQSLRLTEITRKLKGEAGNATHFVVFDACRNTLKLTRAGSRALVQSKGFVPVSQESGMLIAYATAEGELASDVGAGAGPFAKVLAEEIVKPGVEAVVMFRVVQRRVRAAIKQEPYLGFNALGDVYLAGLAVEPPKPVTPQVSEAERTWAWLKNTTDQSVLENFIKQFGGTPFGEEAKARLTELKKQQVAIAAPPKAPAPVPQPKPTQPAAAVTPTPPPSRCDGVEALVGNEKRCLKSKDTFKDCDTCPEMVVVPAGEFMMGSPKNEEDRSDREDPQHEVMFAKPFAVGRFAVTRGEFAAFVGETTYSTGDKCLTYDNNDKAEERAGRSFRNPGFAQDDRHPAVCVSWDDAKAFVAWLSKKAGKTYRLLSESEREYAARAGTSTPFWWGASISTKQANYNGRYTYGAKGEYRQRTVPVDSFEPNPWGLYNVHGNVWEWVDDCWHDNYQGAPKDGSAWKTGECKAHVLRRGSWGGTPKVLRSAVRARGTADHRNGTIGFRLARTLSP